MGKIGQRIVFTVAEAHATDEGRYVLLKPDETNCILGDASYTTSPLTLDVPDGVALPAIGTEVVLLGGFGLDGCLTKAEPAEPIFVLLGRDPNAPRVVREWVSERLRAAGRQVPLLASVDTLRDLIGHDASDAMVVKLHEALDQAEAMEAWPGRKLPG